MAFGTKRLVFIITGTDQLTPVLKKIQGQAATTSEKMNAAGKLMTKAITLPVLAAAGASVKMATDFQTSMKRVQTQAGASAKDVTFLSKQVLQLGLYAQQGPKELADSMFHLKSIGLDNANAMKALKTASDLAAVGNANLEDTTNALGGAWRSGIKGAQNFTESAASLNAIVGAGNLSMQQLTDAIGTGFLPTARSFGLSLNQVGAALALMTDEGIPAQVAATRLRTAITMMGAPTAKAADALDSIGIGANGLAKAMRSPGGIYSAMVLLRDHINKAGLNAVQSARLIATAFGGARTGSAILTLYNNMNVLDKKQKQINSTMGKFGPAVAAQRKTAQAQFALLKSSIEVTAVRLGTVLLPAAVAVTKQFSKLVTLFTNMPAPVQTAIMAILGIAAVVGPLLVVIAKIIEATKVIKELAVVQALFSAELYASPITWYVAAFVALIAIIVVVIKYHKQLWQIAQNVWNWLRAHQWVLLFVGVIAIIAEIGMHWRGIKTIAVDVWHAIYTAATTAWNAIKTATTATLTFLKPVFNVIRIVGSLAFETIATFAQIAWDIVSGLGLLAWALLKPVFNGIAAAAKWVFNTILAPVAKYAWNVVVVDARLMWKIVNGIFHVMASIATWLFKNVIAPVARYAWNVVVTDVRIMWSIVHPILNLMGSIAKTVFGGISKAATAAWNWVVTKVHWVLSNIRSIFSSIWKTISSVFSFIINGAAKAFAWVPGLGGKLKDAAKKFNKFRDDVNNAIKGVKNKKFNIEVGFSANAVGSTNHPIGKLAGGGYLRGPGTGTSDSIPAYLSNGEYVMPAHAVKKYGVDTFDSFRAHRYADGGLVPNAITPKAKTINTDVVKAIQKLVNQNAALMGNGSSIVQFARSFVGRVPYVWGGTTTGGWDCSGFTSYVYKHFGIDNIPRVSQDQQRWARRSGNVPGGLVFFGNPAYHVGIATGGPDYIGADSPAIGTAIRSVLGNSGFGIPPQGLGGFGGGPTSLNAVTGLGREMAARYGWVGANWTALYKLWQKESNWNPRAQNPSSGAAGIPQDISGNFHGGAAGQIAWGLRYILGRYGSPLAAWNHEVADNWYRKGGLVSQSFDTGRGVLRPGYTLAHNGTGRNEYLSTGGGGVTVNVYPQAVLGTKREVARYVSEALQEYKGKGGRTP